MAQSAVTVTPPNPTPPTNLSCVGATPPTDPLQAFADDGTPGTGTAFAAKTAAAGTGTSVEAEGKGTETVVTATVPNPSPAGQLVTVSCLGNYTSQPNQDHASSLSPPGPPTLVSLGANNTASGAGTVSQTITGTNFSPGSVIYVNGVAQATTYTSRTSVTAAAVTKKATAGTWAVQVKDGNGAVESNSLTWTFT